MRGVVKGAFGSLSDPSAPFVTQRVSRTRLSQQLPYAVHSLTGIAGGLGYAALVGLVADRTRDGSPGPVRKALAACGQWSLTCYLLQSVVFVALFVPYLGGLSTRVGGATASAIAVITWLGTVVLAAGARSERTQRTSRIRIATADVRPSVGVSC